MENWRSNLQSNQMGAVNMSASEITLGILITLIVPGSFVIGYLLAKLKLLNDENSVTFCTWVSACFGGYAAFMSGPYENAGWILQFFGRLAMFFLFYYFWGIIFTFGVCTGMEKANK